MKKAIIFISDTGDTKVNEMVKEVMHDYCMDNGYEVVVSVKDADSVQMSSMMYCNGAQCRGGGYIYSRDDIKRRTVIG